MILFVKLELSGRTIVIETTPEQTIFEVKSLIASKTGYEKENMILYFGAKMLVDTMLISDYGLQNLYTLRIITRLSSRECA